MLILVDKNEESSNPKIVNELRRKFSQVIVTNLPHRSHGGRDVTAGDINIPLADGNILAIERKTPEDFLGSIPKRHIFHQVEVMANHAKYSAIIITGTITFTSNSDSVFIDGVHREGWHASSVQAALTAIQFSGCPIIFCPPSEYCTQISALYSLVNKPDKHQGVVKNRIITFPPIDARVEYIAQMPGVGIKLADSLLKFAGKMDNNADEDGYGGLASAFHWLSIMVQIDKSERPAGWGPQKILNARVFFGLDSNQYIALPKEVEIIDKREKKKKEIVAVEMDGHHYERLPF